MTNSSDGALLSAHPTEIETFTGVFVDVASPDPSTIDLKDIAQGLAYTCRYGGQINQFYSIAEHCSLVHDLLIYQGYHGDLAFAGLFHDAPEAYLGDIVAPLKYALRGDGAISTYDALDKVMEAAIAERFNIPTVALRSGSILTADLWALRIEARKLTYTGGVNWRWPGELPEKGELPDEITWFGGQDPWGARVGWLERAKRYV